MNMWSMHACPRIACARALLFGSMAVATTLIACAPGTGSYGSAGVGSGGAMPSCDSGPSANVAGFNMTVEDVRWTDQVSSPMFQNPMMPNLPPQAQAYIQAPPQQQGAGPMVLAIDVRISNTTNRPLTYSPMYFVYQAFSDGAQYAPQSSGGPLSALNRLNPGRAVKGEVRFDAPSQGSLLLKVGYSKPLGATMDTYLILKCSVAPLV